jgi:hypothetical protein
VFDDGLDVFVFPHVRSALLALLFKTLEDGIGDCAMSLRRGCDSIEICVEAWSLVCARHEGVTTLVKLKTFKLKVRRGLLAMESGVKLFYKTGGRGVRRRCRAVCL